MTTTNKHGIHEITLAEAVYLFRRQLTTLWHERRAFRVPIGIATILGLTIALGSTPEYRASTKLVPYGAAGTPAGLSGLAGLAGLELPSTAGGGTVITVDLYPDVARTFEFRRVLATTPIPFADRDTLLSAAEYLAETLPAGISRPRTFETGPSDTEARAVLRRETEFASPKLSPTRIDPESERLVTKVGERISVQSDRKTGIITLSGTMPDPVGAAALVKLAADLLTERIATFEVQKADEQLRFLDKQFDESRLRYDAAQRALASFADRNRILTSARAQIERNRLEREVDIAFGLFQQFSREREQARIKRSQDTPAFAVLEEVTVPNTRLKPRRMRILLSALAIGFLLGIMRIWWGNLDAEARRLTIARKTTSATDPPHHAR